MSTYVYEWREDGDRFCGIAGVDASESKGLSSVGGADYCSSICRPLRLRPVYGDKGKLPFSDFPFYGAQPKILSAKAWAALSEDLLPCGASFPAVVPESGEEFRVWFPSVVSDCLDEEKTEFLETLSGFRKPLKPVFVGAAIPESGPFTVKGYERLQVWVRKSFTQRVKSHGLTGAVFSRRAPVVP